MRQVVECSWEAFPKHGEELCGDYVEIMATPCSFIAVLSDGLGSGVKANILATLTAKIASTMFAKGASVEDVMETLVNTLPECNVRKLAYATFQMLRVQDGRDAYLVEYDCPPLILVRRNQVVDLPIEERVVNGRTVREARFALENGDYMVLVSDGYEHAGVGGLYRLGWGWRNIATSVKRWCQTGSDAYGLTRALTRTCLKLYDGRPGDDATAVGMHVRDAVTVTIWTGPPADKALDASAVERLMSAEGTKVICGGTTAQIAARVLGQELVVEWLPPSKRRHAAGRRGDDAGAARSDGGSRRKGTPPVAHLSGVDLVTEGIVTLGQALELLEGASSVHDLPNDDDAATRLARILLSADDIHLVVGTAINPNQVADVIRGETMRMVYIKELVRELERHNKQVTLERI